ncbi:MAG: molybdenum cofactor guanylyltransferase [Promethearchaeia archaeon]
MSDNHRELAFVILIGGKSRRFGTDKGLFEFRGKPLIEYQLQRLRKFNRKIFISTKSKMQLKNYREKIQKTDDLTFILDEKDVNINSKIKTPLIGIYSAFQKLKELNIKSAFTLPCDSPLIHPDVVGLIIDYSKSFDCVIPQWENGFLEPLFAIYPVESTYYNARENLLKGHYKLIKLLDSALKIKYISIEKEIQELDEDLQTFLNVNKKSDLKELRGLFQD